MVVHPNGLKEFRFLRTAIATSWIELHNRNMIMLKRIGSGKRAVTDLHIQPKKYKWLW